MFLRYFILFILIPVTAFSQSTSPDPQLNMGNVKEPNADEVITFSEFPLGTYITDQYQDFGIIFGGSNPFICTDGANPTSPVLSGTPRFRGDITGVFVDPNTGNNTVVESFTFDAGYFDEIGSTRVQWFDPEGNILGQRINSIYGIETMTFQGGNIASWKIEIVKTEPAGYAIDNVHFEPKGSSILFREKLEKDGTWGRLVDEIPGFDHCALHNSNVIYECHPGYEPGTYVSEDGDETVSINWINGVQGQFTLKTFKHDSQDLASSPVINFEEIPIDSDLANNMREIIESAYGNSFQRIDFRSLEGIVNTLSPGNQKGGNNSFTCVGLVEWAAEMAGHNDGQGFIPNNLESFNIIRPNVWPPELIEIPLLSPQVLNWSMKSQNILINSRQWIMGFFDPVDFILTDPFGRRIGYIQDTGFVCEIPHSFYSGNGNIEYLLIPQAVPGNYTIEYTGVGENAFGAISSCDANDVFNDNLELGENSLSTHYVKPTIGCAGDLNGDGNVDEADINSLNNIMDTFTDGLGHPGDLNRDGFISEGDLLLLEDLTELVKDCDQPVLALIGYQDVAFNDPLWEVQVGVRNEGPGVARNISVEMNKDIAWLTIPDATCNYSEIAEGGTSYGDNDSYTFDLTNHPGGSFNVWFDVTYEDECGNQYQVRLDPEFEPGKSEGDTPITTYRLAQNYPNPFNPSTTISYQIPKSGRVELSIYDVSGRLVRKLVNEYKSEGLHTAEWNGKDSSGRSVSSGIYFYRMKSGEFLETRRMVLLR